MLGDAGFGSRYGYSFVGRLFSCNIVRREVLVAALDVCVVVYSVRCQVVSTSCGCHSAHR